MSLNNDQDRDRVVHELREAGLKATPQRVAIAAALSGDVTHPTAQEIFHRLQGEFPGMSFATVYNTLSALERVGRVRPLNVGGPTRFDPNVDAHHHAICDRCGAVRDVPLDGTEHGDERLVEGFEIERVERIYRGVCAACRAT